MRYRTHRGEKLPEIGLGCYALSGAYGKRESEPFVKLIRRAHDLGVTFFDTADIYGPAEEVLGRAVAPFRDRIWIATKVGWGVDRQPDCSAEHVLSSCEQSLARLGTDYVDLYQIHFNDPGTPVQETVGALDRLRAAGKIRYYGVGHLPRDRMAEYMAAGEVFSALIELSAVARGALEHRLPLCRERGVGVIAFSVTGRGLLTGKIEPGHTFEAGDIRRVDPLFQRERFASGLRVAERLKALGANYGKTPAQVAIAWVLAQPGIVCALTGASTIPHLEENLEGSGWSIEPDDLAAMEQFLAAEDERVRQAQARSLGTLLTASLGPESAFADLVYVLETLVEGGIAAEEEVLPFFGKLMPLRGQPAMEALEALQGIQAELRERFLPLVAAELPPEPGSHQE
jgi:aryl-alcohol dehydrogenase-like predicted oxidoreductase